MVGITIKDKNNKEKLKALPFQPCLPDLFPRNKGDF